MRIVIDLQGAQTESRFRGIGRYSMSLTKEMVKQRGEHEIIIALNGLFPETIEPIRAEFDGLLPQENIRVWYAPGPVRECEPGNEWRRQAAERIREAFLASLSPDIIFITSLFEGYVDDAVTSIGVFDDRTPVFVILYDFIPLASPDQYLTPNPTYKTHYLNKIEHLKKAKSWLCISEATAKDAKNFIDTDEKNIINISTACDDKFCKIEISQEQEYELRKRYHLSQPFILYTGGSDIRKNLHGLIRAYAQLPSELRKKHQLVLAGKMPEGDISSLKQTEKDAGLRKNQLIFTGYVSDEELVQLYNLCELFVFPSRQEGFGLPVLEAMSCGAPVICGDTSSLPEVVCYESALFDPSSEKDLSAKIIQGLSNDDFRNEFLCHCQEQIQKFSWQNSALQALHAIDDFYQKFLSNRQECKLPEGNLKLAYVSPLPPERTGIADYSAELLPELSKYYEIEVIVDQAEVTDNWIKYNLPIRSVQYFQEHVDNYDRVLYHFGNSPFHRHMFSLIEKIPGVTCLHDFFMSGYSRYMEVLEKVSYHWCRDLYHSHGYKAVSKRFQGQNNEDIMYEYPCNLKILQASRGIIVHSDYAKKLAQKWYNEEFAKDWTVIPHLRAPKKNSETDKSLARQKLGFSEHDIIVCSFGLVAPTKLNQKLLNSWLNSELFQNANCFLIFVGENHGGEYGKNLKKTILKSRVGKRVHITGWTSSSTFCDYLAASDIAVQLRAYSRGETSGTVLDCMNYGLATIVNDHGSLPELPKDAVWMLNDNFKDEELIIALQTLFHDRSKRNRLGGRAQEVIHNKHLPEICARQYAEHVEYYYKSKHKNRLNLVRELVPYLSKDDILIREMASCIAQNQPDKRPAHNLFIDVSATCRNDLKTGIERVTRALLQTLIYSPPAGYRIEPVYLSDQTDFWHYRYARKYTLSLLGCHDHWLAEAPIEAQPGDKLFIPELSGAMLIEAQKAGVYNLLKQIGVRIFATVHDLLPIKMPHYFPPSANNEFEAWIKSICEIADCAICVSKSTANDLNSWLNENCQNNDTPQVSWIHHGADLGNSIPSSGLPEESEKTLNFIKNGITFLMVGTIEPRKGHLQTIAAFDELWAEGVNVNLVVVGKEGWQDVPEENRRTIPQIVKTLKTHPELNSRLFWLSGISDEYLEKIYTASTCLIAASEGEGFGLPLIEAAQHKLPIIARDIPVFREVAGEYAYYFKGKEPDALAYAVKQWLELYKSGAHPRSDDMPWLTWEQSAEQLKNILVNKG